jgi:hypothetical protein
MTPTPNKSRAASVACSEEPLGCAAHLLGAPAGDEREATVRMAMLVVSRRHTS